MLFYSYILSKQSKVQLFHITGYSEPLFWDFEIHGGIFHEDLSRAKHVAATLSIYRRGYIHHRNLATMIGSLLLHMP